MNLARKFRAKKFEPDTNSRSADNDFDATIARMRDAIGRGDEQLSFPARDRPDVVGGNATGDQRGPNGVGTALSKRIVELVGTHCIGMANDEDIRHGTKGDLG